MPCIYSACARFLKDDLVQGLIGFRLALLSGVNLRLQSEGLKPHQFKCLKCAAKVMIKLCAPYNYTCVYIIKIGPERMESPADCVGIILVSYIEITYNSERNTGSEHPTSNWFIHVRITFLTYVLVIILGTDGMTASDWDVNNFHEKFTEAT
ncbi:unnamed protein product [Allacma fusca]|uniref:Uncharacterized protein n=1 Tax=Allacma fusca TaxID=39272 RepID=A0A8J2NIP9_9HEXA|nr:unnamed protein product [Allacma fusca]